MTGTLDDPFGKRHAAPVGNRSPSGALPMDQAAYRMLTSLHPKAGGVPVHDAMLSSPCYEHAINPTWKPGEPK